MRKIIILLVVFVGLQVQAQTISKVEPPNWWVGMKNPKLQLMVYGKEINNLNINISDKDIILDSVTKTENPNYLFLNLDLSKAKSPKVFDITFQEKKQKKQSISYELKQREKNSANRNSFDSSDLIYLIMPDRFSNGNLDNDSTDDTSEKANRKEDGGRHGGDIQGIINHLDYLDELGVTAIWNTPLLEDNEPRHSYHGYAQSNYYKIDPRYGTNEDYKRLADELHKKDMKLIMDYVTNHWGSKHWMIQDLPAKDFLNYWENGENGYKRSSYRMATQFDANVAAFDAKACMNGWFDTTMPDMNQRNPLVLNYLIQNAIWWIEYTGLDGLRVDTYSYNDKEGIAKWTKSITDEYPNFNIVGEVWMDDQAQMAYWQKDSKIGAIQGFNSHLPSVMDFTLFGAISSVFNENNANWNDGMIKLYNNFINDFLYPNIDNILVFAENHDTQRINQQYPNIEDYKLVMTLVATVRGMPQIYYGSEIGMKGDKGKGDGDIRHDFPGGWQSDAQNAFLQSERSESQNEYFNFTKQLFNWRKGNNAIHVGKTMQFVPENNAYVFFRYNDDETVMVVVNNNPKKQILDLNRFSAIIKGSTSGKEIITDTKISLESTLTIEGKSSMIIELNK